MKKFRRSHKSTDKIDASKAAHISIPTKDPIAIIPPKKVIKALYDYQVQDPEQNPGYLSFAQGDFLHVVGRENDTDWYDACNPLHNTRGLVPVNHFELVGKRVRNSESSSNVMTPASSNTMTPASSTPPVPSATEPAQPLPGDNLVNGGEARKSTSNRGGNMVYGIVLFDFKAERPDELDAKAGEAIIVIAQSNPEWFVAKPITRLGGPGLIPVSFIEIKDMTTGEPVEDVQDAVRKAGVPKVEEWKRMAAEYKNSSVSLGKLNFGSQQQQQALQQSMDRLSIGSARRSQDASRYANDIRPHQRNGSAYAQAQYYQQQQQQQIRNSQLMTPVRARIPGFLQRDGDFIFNVQAVMEDGRAWNLQRSYKDFYGLQLHLIEQFPEAAGRRDGIERTLPMMPGPLVWVTEKLTRDRCGHLNVYLHKLLQMPIISQSHVVRGFFYPKDFDVEIQPPDELMQGYTAPRVPDGSTSPEYRLSDGSQPSGAQGDQRQSNSGNINGDGYGSPQKNAPNSLRQYRSNSPSGPPPSQRQPQPQPQPQPAQIYPQPHYRSPSELRTMNGTGQTPPPMLRNNSAMTSASANSANSGHFGHAPNGTPPVKIKVWFGETNCVVIRLPAGFNHADLVNKLRERWSLEPGVDRSTSQDVGFEIEYRDDATQAYYRIISDEELAVARDRNEKLTLRVSAVSGMM